MPRPTRFIAIWGAALLACACLAGGLNAWVDPYDVFGSRRIAGFNAFKPNARNHTILTKTYQIERVRPVTVLLGSSRVDIGIDAADPAWPASMQPVYNYGLPGWDTAADSLRSLRQAAATGRLKHAVMLLDFENLLDAAPAHHAPTDNDRRLLLRPDGRANPDRSRQVLNDAFLSLFTMDALLDSFSTVLSQRREHVQDLPANGSSAEADFINAARTDGMHELFAQKEILAAGRARDLAGAGQGREGGFPNLATVAALIQFCVDHDITLILVIAPSHVSDVEVYWKIGLWPALERLKAELASLVATDGKKRAVLWDFMDCNAYTTEPVPPAGDRRTQTRWFWELSHFKKRFGALLIETILGGASNGLGVILTPDMVAARNADVRARIDRWHDGLSVGTETVRQTSR